MTATCGPTSGTPLAYWDRDSSCWRTSQVTFLSEDQPSLENLPHSGFTSDGWLYEQPMSATAIAAPDCSSSALLPTPRVSGDSTQDADGVGYHADGYSRASIADVARAVTLLPTPVANDDHKTAEAHIAAKVRSGAGAVITSLDVMTRQAAQTGEWSNQLLPTPRTSDANGGGASR